MSSGIDRNEIPEGVLLNKRKADDIENALINKMVQLKQIIATK